VAQRKSPRREEERAPTIAPTNRWTALGICFFLVAIIWVVFGQTAHFGFVNYDDNLYVYENAKVMGGLTRRGVAWVFTHAECKFYHPLTMLSLMLDYQLHGLEPGWYHLTNVLIHAASAVLLFLILRRMTGALWRSAFVAAVFAIHPLRVESVAWVTERKDVLGTFFFMLTLGAYVRYALQPNSLGRYLMVAGAFLLDLLCKPTAVTLPFLLLLLDYWPLGRMGGIKNLDFRIENGEIGTTDGRCAIGAGWEKRVAAVPFWGLVREKIPLLALAAGACVVTYLAEGKAVASIGYISMPMRIGNVLISYVVYLRQMVWPAGLAAYYPYPGRSQPLWEIGLAFLVLAAITGVVLEQWRRRPWLGVGWFWYLGMLVPVIGIVQVGEFAHADRSTYLPQIGLYVVLTWAAMEMSGNWRHRRLVQGGLAAAILVALVFCARAQTSYWRNSETLWTHALSYTSASALAHTDLGIALEKEGRAAEAIRQYEEALRIQPDYALAHYNLGNGLLKKGLSDQAVIQYEEAIRSRPDFADARNNLGAALDMNGRTDEAIRQFQEAIRLKPDYTEAINNLGAAFDKKGQTDEAIRQFQEAIRLKPDYTQAHNNLGIALGKKGEIDEAIRQYQEAVHLQPDFFDAHNNLGIVLGRKGQIDEAIGQLQEAIRLQPGNELAHYNLGFAQEKKGRTDEAISQYQEAIRLKPDYADAHHKLGGAFDKAGRGEEAAGQYLVVLRLTPDDAEVNNSLGYLWAERGEKLDQARAMIEKAVQKEPKNAGYLDSLGWVLFKQNRPGEALDYQLRAIQNCSQPEALLYDHLGDIYAALDQRDKAAEAWRKSLSVEPNPGIEKQLGALPAP
jgi:tetratricopeptide (TPR) repeat protein